MKNKTKKKKITMDVLAGMISAGTKETKNFVREEVEGLAGMVQRGFKEAADNLGRVENNVRILSENNTREHEEIKLRLGDVAYKFELIELQRRVEVLEKKLQVKKD